MRILSINNAYYIRGGADRHFFQLNSLLKSQGQEVIPFSVKNSKNLPSSFEPFFLSHLDFLGPKRILDYPRMLARVLYSFEAKNKAGVLIKETRPQIAHVFQTHHSISPSVLPLFKSYRIPIIHTVFNFDLICPNYTLFFNGRLCQACKSGGYLQALLKRCHKGSFRASLLLTLKTFLHRLMKIYENNVDIFIVPSKFMKNILIDYRFDKKKLVYIPLFVDTSKYSPSYSHSDYLVYFGRLVEGKGLLTLIQAMRKISGTKVYITGQGPLEASLKRFVEEHNLTNVKFLGFREDDNLKVILAGARFSVFPSEAYESFGLSIIESFAMGKPVIGSNLGPIPEIIEEGINGLLFEPGDAEDLADKIQYLIDHQDLAGKMGRRARAKAEKEYNPKAYYDRIMEVYRQALGSKHKPVGVYG